MPIIRVVLAIAALQDYHLRSIDISYAYLNGKMDCDVYMEQPEGFCEGDPRQTVEELNAHSTNGTWKLVPRPTGKKVIGSKWVFVSCMDLTSHLIHV